jgi:hypothetical protein
MSMTSPRSNEVEVIAVRRGVDPRSTRHASAFPATRDLAHKLHNLTLRATEERGYEVLLAARATCQAGRRCSPSLQSKSFAKHGTRTISDAVRVSETTLTSELTAGRAPAGDASQLVCRGVSSTTSGNAPRLSIRIGRGRDVATDEYRADSRRSGLAWHSDRRLWATPVDAQRAELNATVNERHTAAPLATHVPFTKLPHADGLDRPAYQVVHERITLGGVNYPVRSR